MNFSDALMHAMKKMGVTKVQLARDTGYSQGHISDLFKGKRRWNEESLARVCSALDITIQIAPTQVDQPQQIPTTDKEHSKLVTENKHLKTQVRHLKDALKSLAEVLD